MANLMSKGATEVGFIQARDNEGNNVNRSIVFVMCTAGTVLRESKLIPGLRTRMIVAMVGLVCSDQLS